MTEKMFIHYDPEGDFLEIRFGKLTPPHYEDLGDDTFQRIDEKSSEVKGYAFFNVQKRKNKQFKDLEVEIPLVSS
ncbi:hypothetical protein CMO93_00985 [Candidatus Woesearchaeota archaeon]|nr:hypothetical protein [Candidatus Woesearchaeota archaeon]|tara:strand:- start:2113 stop:2337 length:225 start_codon:yes stop_codon:yes gene_type:complete